MKRIQIYIPEQFKCPPYIEVAAGIYAQTGGWPGDTLYVTALRLPIARGEQPSTQQSVSADMLIRQNAIVRPGVTEAAFLRRGAAEPDTELDALLLHFCLLAGETGEEIDAAGRHVRFIIVMGRSLADMQNLVRCSGKTVAIRKYAYGEHICERLIIG